MIRFYILLIIIAAFINSCTPPSYSLSGASINYAVVKTATVKYFQNRSENVRPLLSRTITEKLKDKIESQTSLKLVNDDGDAVFEGEITEYSISPAAVQSDNVAAQNRLTITVHVKYSNPKDNQFEFDSSFSRYADFPSSRSVESVEEDLINEISNQLVDDIFNKAFVNW